MQVIKAVQLWNTRKRLRRQFDSWWLCSDSLWKIYFFSESLKNIVCHERFYLFFLFILFTKLDWNTADININVFFNKPVRVDYSPTAKNCSRKNNEKHSNTEYDFHSKLVVNSPWYYTTKCHHNYGESQIALSCIRLAGLLVIHSTLWTPPSCALRWTLPPAKFSNLSLFTTPVSRAQVLVVYSHGPHQAPIITTRGLRACNAHSGGHTRGEAARTDRGMPISVAATIKYTGNSSNLSTTTSYSDWLADACSIGQRLFTDRCSIGNWLSRIYGDVLTCTISTAMTTRTAAIYWLLLLLLHRITLLAVCT